MSNKKMYSEYLNNLIITADDFGINEKTNKAVLDLVKDKKVDRVSVMIGGKISDGDVENLLESGVKLDIHLHLQDKESFEKERQNIDRRILKRAALFLVDFISGRYSSRRIKIIWKRQIKEFHDIFGKYPDGINSHEYLHFFPSLFKITIKFKEEFSIPYLRLGKIKLEKFGIIAFILDRLRRINVKANRILFTAPDFAQSLPFVLNTSDFLVSFDWIENRSQFFENLPDYGQTELIFHPEIREEFKFLKENF